MAVPTEIAEALTSSLMKLEVHIGREHAQTLVIVARLELGRAYLLGRIDGSQAVVDALHSRASAPEGIEPVGLG